MIKKKLTALIAAVLILVMVFPATAFAYSQESEQTQAESADAPISTDDTTEADSDDNEGSQGGLESFLSDPDVLRMLMAGMDPEILEVLKEHPKLIAMLLPTLHVTVTEGKVTISIDGETDEDPAQTGTVTTQGGKLNVRTGPSTGYDIITQLTNGSTINVLGEKDGWYRIEIPARYGYVCGEYLRVNDIPSTQTDEGYSFDIDGTMILSFLELFIQDEPATESSGHGLTPSGNLTLVDDYGERNGEGQQFITLVTKSGNYFYLIIDRDEKGEETVHFLNLVDERDLFALMEDGEKAAYESQLAAEQAAREAAERAAAEAASQTGESQTGTEDPDPQPEKKSVNMLPIVIIILVMAAVGGGWFFMQTKKKKQAASGPDPDADYTDEDDEDYGAGEEDDSYDVSDEEDPYEAEPADDESGDDAGEDQ